MLYKRFIPKIVVTWDAQFNGYISVLTRKYQVTRRVGDPVSQIKIMQSNLVDEIVLVNKATRYEGRFAELVKEVSLHMTTPLTVGGAISELEQASELISCGADKVILSRNSRNSELMSLISQTYGAQSVVMSYDYQLTSVNSTLRGELIEFCNQGVVGELSLNSVDKDGSMAGPELGLLTDIIHQIEVPVVIGCGFSKISDFWEAYKIGVSGITVSTFLASLDQSPRQVRSHLASLGVHIRH